MCNANQLTGFYRMGNIGRSWINDPTVYIWWPQLMLKESYSIL